MKNYNTYTENNQQIQFKELFELVNTNKYDELKHILSHGGFTNILNEVNPYFFSTILEHVVLMKIYKFIPLLCEYGADVNQLNSDGYSLLLQVIGNDTSITKKNKIIKILLENGADSDIKKDDRTPLILLAYKYHFRVNTDFEHFHEIFRTLIKSGADLTIETINGKTFLDIIDIGPEKVGKILTNEFPEEFEELIKSRKAKEFNL